MAYEIFTGRGSSSNSPALRRDAARANACIPLAALTARVGAPFLCAERSVGWSVGRSAGRSAGRLVIRERKRENDRTRGREYSRFAKTVGIRYSGGNLNSARTRERIRVTRERTPVVAAWRPMCTRLPALVEKKGIHDMSASLRWNISTETSAARSRVYLIIARFCSFSLFFSHALFNVDISKLIGHITGKRSQVEYFVTLERNCHVY